MKRLVPSKIIIAIWTSVSRCIPRHKSGNLHLPNDQQSTPSYFTLNGKIAAPAWRKLLESKVVAVDPRTAGRADRKRSQESQELTKEQRGLPRHRDWPFSKWQGQMDPAGHACETFWKTSWVVWAKWSSETESQEGPVLIPHSTISILKFKHQTVYVSPAEPTEIIYWFLLVFKSFLQSL